MERTPVGLREWVGGRFGGVRRSGDPLLDTVVPLLVQRSGRGLLGGLSGVLGRFARAGLGKKADSWVAAGPNDALSSDEVERALGSDTVARLASRAGVPARDASSSLAALLPTLIDSLTPGGTVPLDLKRSARSLDLAGLAERAAR